MYNKDHRLNGIENYLARGQREPFFQMLSELGNSMKTVDGKDIHRAMEAYYAVALDVLSHINRRGLAQRVACLIDVDKLMRIDSFGSWEAATEYLHEITAILFDIHGEAKQDSNAVDSVQAYIKQHLNEDLSLARLAEKVFLNASYLSRLYKKTTGVKLSEYIENTRMQKAKELLAYGNIKINEVAKQVGYETAASFIRFFKKATGCTPQEYRKQNNICK